MEEASTKKSKVYVKDGIEIAKKMGQLYVTYRKKFIEQYQDKENNDIKCAERKFALNDSMILKHLTQEKTIGVFSGSIITSFMCFDVDIKDDKLCEWAVYKIVNALQDLGIAGKYIHISISGSKGYHIEIFFDEPVYLNNIETLYLMVLNETDLLNIDYGEIELRPCKTKTNKVLGVKLPLGKNLKTNNTCWFCDYGKGLLPIKKYDYVLSIESMPKEILLDILEKEDDITVTPEQQDKIEAITEKHKPLSEYKNNVDEKYTVEQIENIITNGLQIKGSRHNALFNIIKYYKHLGVSQEDNKEWVTEWMHQQDKTTYTTKWETVLLDIEEILEYVYTNNCSFVIKNLNIDVSMEEIMEIIKIKGKNNQLTLYSLLVHSKRYSVKSGQFYMSYNQMMEVTGLTKMTLIKIIHQLEDLKLIVVTRGGKAKYNTKLNKPITDTNRYIINLLGIKTEIENEVSIAELKSFKVCDKNCVGCFNACLFNMYSKKDLKVILSERNYSEVIKYKDYCTNIMVNV